MANSRPENVYNSQPSPYRLPLSVGAVGAILLMLGLLGFLFPVQGWNWLPIVLGFALLFAVAFSIRLWFIGDWIPTLFADKEQGKGGDLPPPPTGIWP